MKTDAIKNFFTGQKWWIVWLLRLLIGAVFVVSGIAKGLDIWGFVYKIEEYLEVWHVDQPHSLCLVAAIAIACAEFLGGLSLVTGCYRRVSVWLLSAIMAVMLPLTLYIYIESPVPDCGCFGDFIVISNAATFWKNVAIVVGLVYLLIFNHKVKGLYHPYLQWMVMMAGLLYFLFVSLYGYVVQPMVDFRSFPVGTQILPDDSEEDESDYDTEIEFIYEKDGEQMAFTIDSLPDSTWTFVARTMGNDILHDDAGTELAIYDDMGDEVTDDVIDIEGEQLIVTLPDYRRASPAYTYTINELKRYILHKGGSLIEITDMPGDQMDRWRDYSMAQYPIYRSESTMIKELVRGTMAVVYIRSGIIVGKRNLGAVDPVKMEEDELAGTDPLGQLEYSDGELFLKVTVLMGIILAVLFALQMALQLLRKHRKTCEESKKND
ncbi:MAG: DoxX family protein [Paramuribaculum sp.]|nr:DoxX family protein [Paramuribaculum sp.]